MKKIADGIKKLQWNDFRAFITVLNVILIMTYGFSIAWFGLAISLLGLFKDIFSKEKMINSYVMHGANVVLNVYFLVLYLMQ